MSSPTIGRYEIERELGRGGMAVVYLARDPYTKRQVAVKVLPRQFTFDPQFRARFSREAEIIASLEHPNIVPVYDFGEHEEQPFIVMRYMPGGSLADRLRGGPIPIKEATVIFARLAAALDEAHARGIIHRDLKPGNILFDARGDPYISDFGIAKLTETNASLTGTGLIGTPAYMSPEQVRGDKDLDGRSDIYALGCILFEILSGKLPYDADTPMGLVVKHLTEPVPRILEANPGLPPGCERVISRAMAKSRDQRFQTAAELAHEITPLGLAQPGPPMQPAYPTKVTPREMRRPGFWRVNTGLAAFGVVIVGVGCCVVAGILARSPEGTAAMATGIAVGWSQGFSILSTPTPTFTATPSPTPTPTEAPTATFTPTLIPTPSQSLSPDTVGAMTELSRFDSQAGYVSDLAFRPALNTLAVSGDVIQLWDLGGNQILHTLKGHAGFVTSIAFNPDGAMLASGGLDNTVRAWDVSAGQLLRTFNGHTSPVQSVAFGPDGRTVASGASDGTISMWDTASDGAGQKVPAYKQAVVSVLFSPDGQTLASSDAYNTILLWDLGAARLRTQLRAFAPHLAYSADGGQLAGGSCNETDANGLCTQGRVVVWDAKTGQVVHSLEGHAGWVRDVAFSPDGRMLASGSCERVAPNGSRCERGLLIIWDLGSGRPLRLLEELASGVNAIAISPDGHRLASAGDNGIVKIWGVPAP